MRTIYIKGIKKFKKNIRKGLYKSSLIEGVDYIEGIGGTDHVLMWIKETLSLREFKKAISAKYVFKNRLYFYTTLEELNPKKKDDFSLNSKDLEIIEEIKQGKYFETKKEVLI